MNVEIAERLATRRKKAGLSQEALAEKLGVSRQAVSKWERSESSPDTDNLIALAQLYGVSLDELLYVGADIEDDVTFEAADRAAERAAGESARAFASGESGGSAEEGTAKVRVGFDGIHVDDGKERVHVSWREGIHVSSAAGDEVHIGRGEATINGKPLSAFEKAWVKFPFPLVVVAAYLLLGAFSSLQGLANMWGIGLFLFFAIPLYYLVGRAIGQRRFAPFVQGAYPVFAAAWFCFMAFVEGEPHPAWVAFLTIPLVEWLACSVSRWWRNLGRDRSEAGQGRVDEGES